MPPFSQSSSLRCGHRWAHLPLDALLALLMLTLLAWPSPAAADPAAPTTCNELLINGAFEEGVTGWAQASAGGYPLISAFNPRSGQWGAYLGGSNHADDRLSQTLTLPSNATSITLSWWWSLESEDTLPNDTLRVRLLRPNGAVLAELWQVDNTAAASLWDRAAVDLTSFAGQQVVVRLQGVTDAANLSDFYVDDLSLLMCSAASARPQMHLPLMLRQR